MPAPPHRSRTPLNYLIFHNLGHPNTRHDHRHLRLRFDHHGILTI